MSTQHWIALYSDDEEEWMVGDSDYIATRIKSEQDARLIAAAPDLLRACWLAVGQADHAAVCAVLQKGVKTYGRFVPSSSEREQCNCWKAEAWAAIKNATLDTARSV